MLDALTDYIWPVMGIAGPAIASVIAFAVAVLQLRKLQMENEKLASELQRIRQEGEARERLVKVATPEETQRYGIAARASTRSAGVSIALAGLSAALTSAAIFLTGEQRRDQLNAELLRSKNTVTAVQVEVDAKLAHLVAELTAARQEAESQRRRADALEQETRSPRERKEAGNSAPATYSSGDTIPLRRGTPATLSVTCEPRQSVSVSLYDLNGRVLSISNAGDLTARAINLGQLAIGSYSIQLTPILSNQLARCRVAIQLPEKLVYTEIAIAKGESPTLVGFIRVVE